MEGKPEPKDAIARLYENESLTDNLTDEDARALLKWAEQQIQSDADAELVASAVSAANASGITGVPGLLAQVNSFLTQELAARGMNAIRAQAESTERMAPPDATSSSTQVQEVAVEPRATDSLETPHSLIKPQKSRRKRKRKKS